jgi:hypothetical protein
MIKSKKGWSVLEKVSTVVPNPINSSLIQEFYQFMMADNRELDSYKKNNLKALILFSHEPVPNSTLYGVQKKEKIFEFLSKRIKNKGVTMTKNTVNHSQGLFSAPQVLLRLSTRHIFTRSKRGRREKTGERKIIIHVKMFLRMEGEKPHLLR